MTSLILTSLILGNLITLPVEAPKFDMEEAINALIWCESRGKEFAVNKKEAHGKSWGILQFRLETLYHFADRYGIGRSDPLDVEFQKSVAREMIKEQRAHKHWSVCWKKMSLSYN